MPMFYVAHHETKRPLPVTEQVLQQARDCGYDMLTAPITTPHFHASVLTLLTAYSQAHGEGPPNDDLPLPLIPALRPVDTPLTPSDSAAQTVAVTSPWIDLASPDPLIAHLSRQVFNLEIAYAAFCGVINVVVQGPRLYNGAKSSGGVSQYARAIKEALSLGGYLQLHITTPMGDVSESVIEEDMGNLARFARDEYNHTSRSQQITRLDLFASWDAWNLIRSVCRYNQRLCVSLTLPRRLPPIAVQSRWYSEPLRFICIPSSSFLVNARGSFVLSKPHQLYISRCMRLRTAPWIMLVDVGPIPGINDPDLIMQYSSGHLSPGVAADASSGSRSPTPAESAQMPRNQSRKSKADPTPHLSYIRYLQRNQPPKTTIERFGGGFQDYLQAPLQPLTDNLESITYEVFEKDPVKYDWYERAIAQALRDWTEQEKSTSSANGAVVIAVVGSGRGPLVTRAIQASQDAGVQVEVYAVEKNPNAYVLLQRHNEEDWGGLVTVVKTDMRAWKGPLLPDGTHGRVDILVSELLGSFADNELSPECLDGVQHVLNPEHGISIPTSYTAHLTPISAPRIHADLVNRSSSDSHVFDTPFVVMLQQIDYLSTQEFDYGPSDTSAVASSKQQPKVEAPLLPDVQIAWAFKHPCHPSVLAQSNLRRGGSASGGGGGATGGDGANEHNVRFSSTIFQCAGRGVCHGIAGFFETVLYAGAEGSVELSTNPVTMEEKSKDMISWFPILFPLKTPIYVPEHAELEISMWRQTDDRKVWYEWMVEAFLTLSGSRVRLGASELHSSRMNGCLM
ncbi:arginine N-methyltransferas-like protein [Mytilinidion resinicola]|uniref:Protein arginine N-methyltransferase n=1 Tax=Mytilinidion resinicola TaxID=574789 RepID=A0A6A6Y8F5_9PEZI|nr:arginine N-methyltransferas-like protein [Mytilinidion resinicola]KAF2804889.1 arginine N-methyltransferas-like protein [Mytilinidion resinicola]